VVIGIGGMVAHFWIERYSGMAWLAATVAAGIVVAGVHVVAVVPLLAWYWAYAIAADKTAVPSPHAMSWRGGREMSFVLWLFGVPALAGGLAFDAVPFVRGAAWCLLTAALLDSANLVVVLRHAYRTVGAPYDGGHMRPPSTERG
jgi:hypothetical protein